MFVYLFTFAFNFCLFACLFVCFCQGPGTAQIGEGGDTSWIVLDEDDEEMEQNDEIEITGEKRNPESATQASQQKNDSKGEKEKTLNIMLKIHESFLAVL